jgi:hypothetical protein
MTTVHISGVENKPRPSRGSDVIDGLPTLIPNSTGVRRSRESAAAATAPPGNFEIGEL